MSAVASQIIFHPAVSQSLKFGTTTLGRDKTYRAIQYFARFYTWYLLFRGEKDAAVPWNALKAHLGTARKLLRLGKPMEHLQAALRAVLSSSSAPEQITTIARQIAYFGYLSLDALVWANSIKFVQFKSETAQKIQRLSNRFWFTGIVFGLLNGIIKMLRIHKELLALKSKSIGDKNLGTEADYSTKAAALKASRAATLHQLTLDSLDVWIPATGLGLTNLNDGVLGIFGLITSLMAARKQWNAVHGKK
ncbi:peroxisomal biogenesis factor 11 [Guyanagaster necrorhizus]|uniref:Peroxisomal biogenesis factor 11 n=1 Tax=Guyanagaster necrorhizus TaxID=856835 RepID=A0A9P7W0Z0_9AGAR|nr:peroxisomal biogenesis factor 11 [Guyanagaster necrorhizus MCA 3950]KAG7450385.1 peroxisomal biogenesis factor 11 [Guyanagaster necrorhizus MCA 3950]